MGKMRTLIVMLSSSLPSTPNNVILATNNKHRIGVDLYPGTGDDLLFRAEQYSAFISLLYRVYISHIRIDRSYHSAGKGQGFPFPKFIRGRDRLIIIEFRSFAQNKGRRTTHETLRKEQSDKRLAFGSEP